MIEKLRPKYLVSKIKLDGSADHSTTMKSTDPGNPDSPFVLMPRKDPAAFKAMLAYAQVCEEDLAREIRVWLEKIADAEPRYGTQGMRNFTHMKHQQIRLFS